MIIIQIKYYRPPTVILNCIILVKRIPSTIKTESTDTIVRNIRTWLGSMRLCRNACFCIRTIFKMNMNSLPRRKSIWCSNKELSEPRFLRIISRTYRIYAIIIWLRRRIRIGIVVHTCIVLTIHLRFYLCRRSV